MPWYGEDGTKGTIAATNGSPTITGTGTLWLTNKAVPSDTAGYALLAPLTSAAILYSIDSVTGDGTMTLGRNFVGTTAGGLTYAIVPIDGPIVELLNDISTLLNSSSYAGLNAAVSAMANGDFLQRLSGSVTNRTTLQVLVALLSGMTEVNVASAANADIGAQTTPKISITGTTQISSLNPSSGTMTPNALRIVRFTGALTLKNNAVILLPGGADITTAAGDTAIFTSDATATPIWRCLFYARASGQPIATALAPASIAPTGLVDLSGAGAGQIKFPATQNASSNANTLDDYEEGTWTPIDPTGHSDIAGTSVGEYIKIGRLVWFSCELDFATNADAVAMQIGGLPFTADATQGGNIQSAYLGATNAGRTDCFPILRSSTTMVVNTNLNAAVNFSSYSAKFACLAGSYKAAA